MIEAICTLAKAKPRKWTRAEVIVSTEQSALKTRHGRSKPSSRASDRPVKRKYPESEQERQEK